LGLSWQVFNGKLCEKKALYFMTITWHGQNCFSLEGKSATVLIDPPAGRLPKANVDILILPEVVKHDDLKGLKTEPFMVETPGEFEIKGVSIKGMAPSTSANLVYRLEMEGLHIGHLGSLNKSDENIEAFFDGVDILLVPTGGGEVLAPDAAAEVVSSIEPRVVIPMHYKEAGSTGLQPVAKFSEAMGMNGIEPLNKLSISPKDLPNEETRLVILQA
jgi:L-ascorbate metabolism protein UlaG (beta-lactamase superfamily)